MFFLEEAVSTPLDSTESTAEDAEGETENLTEKVPLLLHSIVSREHFIVCDEDDYNMDIERVHVDSDDRRSKSTENADGPVKKTATTRNTSTGNVKNGRVVKSNAGGVGNISSTALNNIVMNKIKSILYMQNGGNNMQHRTGGNNNRRQQQNGGNRQQYNNNRRF